MGASEDLNSDLYSDLYSDNLKSNNPRLDTSSLDNKDRQPLRTKSQLLQFNISIFTLVSLST